MALGVVTWLQGFVAYARYTYIKRSYDERYKVVALTQTRTGYKYDK